MTPRRRHYAAVDMLIPLACAERGRRAWSSERLTSTASEGKKAKAIGQPEGKTVLAAAHAGKLEVFAIAIGQNLTDQSAAGKDVETHRRFWDDRRFAPSPRCRRGVTRST